MKTKQTTDEIIAAEDWCGDHMPAVYGAARSLGLLDSKQSP